MRVLPLKFMIRPKSLHPWHCGLGPLRRQQALTGDPAMRASRLEFLKMREHSECVDCSPNQKLTHAARAAAATPGGRAREGFRLKQR